MGGLRKKMPITAVTCLAGALALAGIFPFAGFFSKDEILAATYFSPRPGHEIFFALALFSVFLTAFYIFRLWFVAFGGGPRSPAAEHAHESPWVMTGPLALLGVLALLAGAVLVWRVPFTGQGFAAFFPMPGAHEGAAPAVMATSLLAAAAGVGLAWAAYSAQLVSPAAFNRRFPAVYALLKNAWYFNRAWELLRRGWCWPALCSPPGATGTSSTAWSTASPGSADGPPRLRLLQTGQLQFYAAVFLIGVLASLLVLLSRAGELFPAVIGRLP